MYLAKTIAQTHSSMTHPDYRPDIDGLRAVAVLSVVVFHAFPSLLPGGFIGVDIFFVISGFLISSIIFENLQHGCFSFRQFYARRIKRIFPSLIVVLLSCLVFGYLCLLPDELHQLSKHVVAGAGFVSNWVLWNEVGYFDNSAETKPLLHLWSLSVEEQFYIVWPILLWLAHARHLSLLWVSILFLCASFMLNIWMVEQSPTATFYSPFTRVWELLCGAVAAWYSLHRAPRRGDHYAVTPQSSFIASFSRQTLSANVPSFLGMGLVIAAFFILHKERSFPGYWALLPALGTVLILGTPNAWFNRVVLSHRLCVWFGLISFPLYLWHWPILAYGRIIYFDTPPVKFRLWAMVSAILLAWLTTKFIERPLRFNIRYTPLKFSAIPAAMAFLALAGIVMLHTDFTQTHRFDTLPVKRKEAHAVGSSLTWFRGREDWLFLGNAYDHAVAKLKQAITPSDAELDEVKHLFSEVTKAGLKHGARTALIMGPDKSSVYPEFLPPEIVPAATRYSRFFLEKLHEIPSLRVYDPTDTLIAAKRTEGLLYWRTDTHWNQKGAYVAYAGFCSLLGIPLPPISFVQAEPYPGDLIAISKKTDIPLHADDNWKIVWQKSPQWVEKTRQSLEETSFGATSQVTNKEAESDQYVWVVGDSFAGNLKPYFNATFRRVDYIGHWGDVLETLPAALEEAEEKPDLIVVVRVERSF
jgi:peptidoglycan/LPS O-acetylase OafA/YrhL